MSTVIPFLRLLLPASLALAAAHAHAQNYPAKPVRVLVGFPPGAGVDITTRLVTPKLAEALGQQFIVDNRAGAAGHIGAELAAKTPPDGYTLLFASASIVMSQTLYPNLNYNIERDFEPIALVASAPFVLVVHPSVPVKSVKELVALAKVPARPAFIRLDRQRQHAASRDGNVQDAGGYQPRARSVQGHAAGGDSTSCRARCR